MLLAQVRDPLGHASIKTTERYDNQTVANLQIEVVWKWHVASDVQQGAR